MQMPGMLFMILGAMLLLTNPSLGQTSKASTDEIPSPMELVNAALQTWNSFTHGVESIDRNGNDAEIPPKYWADAIKKMKPIRVYDHFFNIVIVLQVHDDIEEGKYITNVISSNIPAFDTYGFEEFEFTPKPQQGNTILDYRRIRRK